MQVCARSGKPTGVTHSDSVYQLYPGTDDDHRWLVADLHRLVGMYSRIGIGSLGDLGIYY